jgi:peptide-methionine (S)-S-oxide reductase
VHEPVLSSKNAPGLAASAELVATRARVRSQSRRAALFTLAAAACGAGFARAAAAASDTHAVPPFAAAGPAPVPASTEVAVLAGGCFWGVQGVYQHVKGVLNAVSGYAGGDKQTAVYETVGTGRTGHAEAVQVTYDPRQVSYARLLQIFFSIAHDPTQLNRQGPDTGTQYRSAIFPLDEAQAQVAKAYIAQLGQARVFKTPIVTGIEPGRAFYPAEDYHQDFLVRNPTYPYIVYNDLPKVVDLKKMYPDLYRPDPVLVSKQRKASVSS